MVKEQQTGLASPHHKRTQYSNLSQVNASNLDLVNVLLLLGEDKKIRDLQLYHLGCGEFIDDIPVMPPPSDNEEEYP
jgi:hypothetical protein